MERKHCFYFLLISALLFSIFLAVGPAPVTAQNDGVSQIVFVSERDGNPEIYIMDADGNNVRRLTNDPSLDFGPVWSPDGSRIAFCSDRAETGIFDIYLMDADGGNLVRLTSSGDNKYPSWSPDGLSIVYVSNANAEEFEEIYVMDSDGGNPRRLTNSKTRPMNAYPLWSPDGAYIAFSGLDPETWNPNAFFIYLMDADGQNLRNVTIGPASFDIGQSWSPDSKSLYFISNRDSGDPSHFKSFTIPIGHGEIQGFSDANGAAVVMPSWSPDKKYITYSNDSGEVYIMDADGQNVRNMTNDPAPDYSPNWSAGEMLELAIPTPAPTHDPSSGPKPGVWSGRIVSGWPGNLTFRIASDGQIHDFNIEVPVFGKPPSPGCKTSLDASIAIQPDGSFAVPDSDVWSTWSTSLAVEGQFGSATEMTGSVLGVCQGDMVLFGLQFSAEWISP